jgi:hypothetical protein
MLHNWLKPLDLIRINDKPPDLGNNGPILLQVLMPFNALVVSLVVVVVFVVWPAWSPGATIKRAEARGPAFRESGLNLNLPADCRAGTGCLAGGRKMFAILDIDRFSPRLAEARSAAPPHAIF